MPVALGILYLPIAYARDHIFTLFVFGMVLAAVFRRLFARSSLSPSPGSSPCCRSPSSAAPTCRTSRSSSCSSPPLRTGGRSCKWLGFASSFVGAFVVTGALVLPGLIQRFRIGDFTITSPLDTDVLNALIALIFVFFGSLAAFLLSWTAGQLTSTLIRARDSRKAALVAEQEVAAEQERTRIARDMHDVVAHSLAVVVAQADGARYLGAKDPAATEAALATIATTARDALSDVRLLLAQLRHSQGDGPQPTLVDLRAHARAAARRRTHDHRGGRAANRWRSAPLSSSPSTASCRSRSRTRSVTRMSREPAVGPLRVDAARPGPHDRQRPQAADRAHRGDPHRRRAPTRRPSGTASRA